MPTLKSGQNSKNRAYSYPAGETGVGILREQLRLFAFNRLPSPSPEMLTRVRQVLSKQERLATLLGGELNFHGQDSGYASHDLHAFAAKFPPQLPRVFIRGLTNPGDIVLDPMMGSGTTVVEALLEGRKAIGLDIDPLAVRLTKAKTTPVPPARLESAGTKLIHQAKELLADRKGVEKSIAKSFDESTKAFIDYWFLPVTQRELMALVLAVREIADGPIRQFLELTFSSIIVTKSGGVSQARDLAHTRPHLDKTKVPKNALNQFVLKLRKNIDGISKLKVNGTRTTVVRGDARAMPLPDESVDLIVTSPPYANAIDYMRAHKFSLVWLGEPVKDLSGLRATYIGSERVGQKVYDALPKGPETVVSELAERDRSKAAVLRKYFLDMKSVFAEMYRVLHRDSPAIAVVGTSVMRGLNVQTHRCLADIAAGIGFDVVGVARRILDRNKRMMPARFGSKKGSTIEQRMYDEYVIGLLKSERT